MPGIEVVAGTVVVVAGSGARRFGFQFIVKELTDPEANRVPGDGDAQSDPPRRSGGRSTRICGRRSESGGRRRVIENGGRRQAVWGTGKGEAMAVNQKRGGTAARTAAGRRQDATSRHDGGEPRAGMDATSPSADPSNGMSETAGP